MLSWWCLKFTHIFKIQIKVTKKVCHLVASGNHFIVAFYEMVQFQYLFHLHSTLNLFAYNWNYNKFILIFLFWHKLIIFKKYFLLVIYSLLFICIILVLIPVWWWRPTCLRIYKQNRVVNVNQWDSGIFLQFIT